MYWKVLLCLPRAFSSLHRETPTLSDFPLRRGVPVLRSSLCPSSEVSAEESHFFCAGDISVLSTQLSRWGLTREEQRCKITCLNLLLREVKHVKTCCFWCSPGYGLAFWAASAHFWDTLSFLHTSTPKSFSALNPFIPLCIDTELLFKPLKVPLDEHFLDNVDVNKGLVLHLFLCQWGFRPHQLKWEKRYSSKAALQAWHAMLSWETLSPPQHHSHSLTPSCQQQLCTEHGRLPGENRDSFVSSPITSGLLWMPGLAAAARPPPYRDVLGCPARHCRRGDKRLGEVMPADHWRGLWDPTLL